MSKSPTSFVGWYFTDTYGGDTLHFVGFKDLTTSTGYTAGASTSGYFIGSISVNDNVITFTTGNRSITYHGSSFPVKVWYK